MSTFLRARLLPRESAESTRVLGGGFEGAMTASAALMAAALIERFNGTNITLALLIEGEMIVLAGQALGNRFVRGLGGGVLSLAFIRMTCVDAMTSGTASVPGLQRLSSWQVSLRQTGPRRMGLFRGAGILLAMVTGAEARREWVPFAWAAIGLAALFIALRRELADVRWQHPIWMTVTFIAGAIATTYGSRAILSVSLTVSVFYACELLLRNCPSHDAIERLSGPLYSVLGTTLLTILLFHEVQAGCLRLHSEFSTPGYWWPAWLYPSE